ncbi:hypothetical protein RISK_006168 [Rhodopirellula islandica]|uniref:Uncharacterized protein n=1 Tax=Rhodopirellula islandica TaxID=595434 RepID=A0A0J1E907_RHOIS|nr:hypothetical protein RISK_006168 [Rhodopirellula islandica]
MFGVTWFRVAFSSENSQLPLQLRERGVDQLVDFRASGQNESRT